MNKQKEMALKKLEKLSTGFGKHNEIMEITQNIIEKQIKNQPNKIAKSKYLESTIIYLQNRQNEIDVLKTRNKIKKYSSKKLTDHEWIEEIIQKARLNGKDIEQIKYLSMKLFDKLYIKNKTINEEEKLNYDRTKEVEKIGWHNNRKSLIYLFNLLNEKKPLSYVYKLADRDILIHFVDEKGKAFNDEVPKIFNRIIWLRSNISFVYFINKLIENGLIPNYPQKYKFLGNHFINSMGNEFEYLAQAKYFRKEDFIDNRLDEIIEKIKN